MDERRRTGRLWRLWRGVSGRTLPAFVRPLVAWQRGVLTGAGLLAALQGGVVMAAGEVHAAPASAQQRPGMDDAVAGPAQASAEADGARDGRYVPDEAARRRTGQVKQRAPEAVSPPPVRRVVSLSPALTESVCVLNACDRLVGVDRFSNWPDAVAQLPHLGSPGSFNVESIAALQPDVVLMASEGVLAEKLRTLGVAVRVMSPERRADVLQVLRALAQMLGVPQQRADAVWADIERQLADLAESVPARARGLRVWLEVDPAPWLATSASLLGETLAGLGLQNVVSDETDAEAAAGSGVQGSRHAGRASHHEAGTSRHEAGASRHGAGASHHGAGTSLHEARTSHPRKAYLQVNREWILQTQPDLLMISDPQKQGLAAVKARPGWQRVQAIRQGRVCLFDGAQLDALVRPGPRLAEGARQMRDCVVRVLGEGAGAVPDAKRP